MAAGQELADSCFYSISQLSDFDYAKIAFFLAARRVNYPHHLGGFWIMKALLDFIPLIAFFIAARHSGILVAAGALLVATLIVYAIHFIRQKGKFDKQQWVVLLLTIVFCGGTLLLRDDIYLRWKSPIINGIFAITLFGSVLINKPLMQLAMKEVFLLSPSGWKKLTLVWALFFAVMASLHYVTAFMMSDEAWINFKTYGWIPIMLVFIVAQFMVLKKHLNPALMDNKTAK